MAKRNRPHEEFGRRLERAQLRAGFKSPRQVIETFGLKRRTYYSHVSGERMPDSEADIQRYAEMFGVTANYLRYGDAAGGKPAAAPEPAKKLPTVSSVSINQGKQTLNLTASHNHGVRPILILSAKDIRQLSRKTGGLASMSGQTLPVPDFLAAGEGAFAYIIPPNDFSMVASDGPSFQPGTALVLDPGRPINPGDKVLVDLQGFDAPLLRVYKAARPYSPGTPFTLVAFNPAFDAIRAEDAGQVLMIARLIWTGHQW